MKKKIIALCVLAVFLGACAMHTHVIGSGGAGATVTKRQLYVVGLVPINDIDTKVIAGDAENYTIVTQTTFVDGLISVLTGGIISIRSVSVTK